MPELKVAKILEGDEITVAFVDEAILLEDRMHDLENAEQAGYVRGYDQGFRAAKRREAITQFLAWLAIAGMFAAAVYFGLAGR